MASASRAVIAMWCGVAVAHAQEPASFRETHAWKRAAPLRIGGTHSVTASREDPSILAVGAEDGAVWLSLDGGANWYVGLEASPKTTVDDENVLTALEAYIGDSVENPDVDLIEESLSEDGYVDEDLVEEMTDQLRDNVEQAAEDVRADLQSQPWLFDADVTGDTVLRVRFTRGHQDLWAARWDGLWYSRDLGTTWRQVVEMATTDVDYLESRGLWVAGTIDGFRFAADPYTFIDAEDGTESLRIHDVAEAPEGMYAGTADGLWFAEDAQAWIPIGPLVGDVLAVLPDPDWDTGLWLSTPDAVLRSDDRGRTVKHQLGAPLSGAVDLLHLGQGHVFAATDDGPWESRDGGTTWQPLSRGLTMPRSYDLAGAAGALLLSSSEGVFRLEPRSMDELVPDPSGAVPMWADPDALVAVAVHRRGLDPGTKYVPRVASTLLPQIVAEVRWVGGGLLGYDVGTGTARDADGTTQARVVFRWTPSGRKSSVDPTTVVMDGDVFVDDGQDRALLSARVRRLATQYRQKITQQVVELWTSRQTLEEERVSMQSASLADRVEHALRIAEVEARLDGLTEGAVSRLRLSPGTEP